MSASGHWIHNLDPILLHLWGDRGVTYYGLSYVTGFVVGVFFHRIFRKTGRSPLTAAQEELALYAMVLGVLVGARLGYVLLYALPETFQKPWFIFEIWKGGMSSHGGFIGVVIACWYVSKKCNIRLVEWGDLMTPLIPVGFLLGRIANFINGELWGKPSEAAWAIIFPRAGDLITPRHPSQLYEAALEGALLLAVMHWRFWRSRDQWHPGRLSGEFLLIYSFSRILCEHFREPDAALILGLSRGTFYTLFLIAGGVFLIWRSRTLTPSFEIGKVVAGAPSPAAKSPAKGKASRNK